MIVKVDGKMKTKMTNDWLVLFPEYKKYAPASIDKRVGPLLVSVWYEILTGGNIRPNSSYFNLANEGEFLCANADTTYSSYTFTQHERGKYHEAAAFLIEKSPIPLQGELTLTAILEGYYAYDKKHAISARVYEDPALIAAWCGRDQLAQDCLERSFLEYRQNREKPIIMPHQLQEGKPRLTFDDWYIAMQNRIANPQALRELVEAQVVRFKLQKIPVYDVIIDV